MKPLTSVARSSESCRWRALVCTAILSAFFTLPESRADVWISEFVADNSAGLRTAAGTTSDWIELANSSSNSVDVGGWYLTDQASTLTKWQIPTGTTIAGNGYLLIFADSSPISVTNNELHASFSLSKDGEYLALVKPDGLEIVDEFAPRFPPQFQDTSYGHSPHQYEVLGTSASARYRVPNEAGTAPWADAKGAIGFSGTNGAFVVKYYHLNADINNVESARNMIANPGYWQTDRTYPIVGNYDTIDFYANSSTGNFTTNALFPGHTYAGEDLETFVVVSDGTIRVPTAGLWTFAVGSDDGFYLRISGHGVEFTSEYPTGRSFAQTLATFNFPEAGNYEVYLVYYENYGGAGLEFSAAEGFQSEFSSAFRLVGDSQGGVMHAGALGSMIDTDISAVMQNVNPRMDAEWTFTVADPPVDGDALVLSVLCADGFSASINGSPVGSLNAPSPLVWNSAATAKRTVDEALQWVTFSVPASLVTTGQNTLVVTALNDSASDSEFLIHPRLTYRAGQNVAAYFKTPTPRSANGQAYTDPTPVVSVSEPRGYKTEAFSVTLAATNPAAVIRYTLDGSVPTTNSTEYTIPLNVSKTTTLRAAVVDPASVRLNVTTVTWLFLEDVLKQGSTPPTGWPSSGQVNGHTMEYGVRQAIVTGDGTRLRNGMTNAIPSISLVTDLANLFNAQRGIYVNPGNDGKMWERPVSVELIDPKRGSASEFHIDAGIRIRGAYSRSAGNPKHSFRLFFRSEYGEGKLRFPLFDEEGASEFDKVDLRTSQNYSWAFERSANETFVRETFSRDSQRDMGFPYTRSRYYHLYINGQYWGLYQTQERGDADFAETYMGGDSDDWDCIKTTQPGYTTTASDGTFTAWHAMHNIAINQGFTGVYTNNYMRLKGLNPDGTRNPAYPVYLDEDNLMVYMLTAYYTGDPDAPVSIWGGMANNMFTVFNRVEPDGFKWLRHDAEHSLGAHGSYGVNCDTTGAGATFTSQASFNPATLHLRLCNNSEYRMRFADLVQKHLYGVGALAPTNAQNRFRSRMSEIDLAIIGESARWGRGYTRDDTWLPACNWVVNTYLSQRRDIIVGHFRNRGWFPSMDAPSYSVLNGEVAKGTPVRITSPGTFYYTTDGSDPRLPGGAINPAAVPVSATNSGTSAKTLISRGAQWRYYDAGAEPAVIGNLTWRDVGYSDGAWSNGGAVLGFAGSSTVNAVTTTTRRYVNGVSGTQVTTTYFRRSFTLDSTNGIEGLQYEILRDDGAVVYLNGKRLFAENMADGTPTYNTYSVEVAGSPAQNTYFTGTVSPEYLRSGLNTIAVEVHQSNNSSSDLYFDFSLVVPATSGRNFADLPITQDVTLKARTLISGEWSALAETQLTVTKPPMDYSALRVSELMYAPPAPESGSPYSADDFAWMELRNTGASTLDLEDVSFAAGITHSFASTQLAPGARLVLAKNPEAFSTRYSTNNLQLLAWTNGNLAKKGETVSLVDPAGTNILTFTYTNAWYPETYAKGSSLVAVSLSAAEPLWSTAENWRPSSAAYGTPGAPEQPSFSSVRLTSSSQLSLDAAGLEGNVELWFSTDLTTWAQCDAGAWNRSGGTININLQHSSFPTSTRCFFRMRVID